MKSYDVLIVGGGPAGSSCGWKLVQAGRRVLVLDKKAFPRNKPCAGWITPQVVAALQLDVEAYRDGRVFQPITGFRCGTIGGKQIECRYDEPVSFGIRRCEFDTYLLDRAGAECQLGESVEKIERHEGMWLINERYSAPMLVGAGGHFCPVGRWLGARSHSPAAVVFAQEVEFKPSPRQPLGKVAAHLPELYFCDDLLGYGWCFRKGDYLNIGLGRTDRAHLATQVAEFRKFLRERERVCCDVPDRFAGHAYQLYERAIPKLFDDGVVLLGDAAGLAYAHSGEGIRPAVESGLIAAAVIVKSGETYRREQLAAYEGQLVERLGSLEQRTASGWVPAAWLRYVGARLLGAEWFLRRTVLDNWFLHRNQQALSC